MSFLSVNINEIANDTILDNAYLLPNVVVDKNVRISYAMLGSRVHVYQDCIIQAGTILAEDVFCLLRIASIFLG